MPKEPTQLERAIDRAMNALDKEEITSEDYATILSHISTLHKMREAEKPSRVSKDTLLITGANLLGIVLIIRHEHVNVITSRAMQLVRPSR
jgi:hypothetical protein